MEISITNWNYMIDLMNVVVKKLAECTWLDQKVPGLNQTAADHELVFL